MTEGVSELCLCLLVTQDRTERITSPTSDSSMVVRLKSLMVTQGTHLSEVNPSLSPPLLAHVAHAPQPWDRGASDVCLCVHGCEGIVDLQTSVCMLVPK